MPDAILRANGLNRAGGQIAQGRDLEEFRHFKQMRQVHHLRDHAGTDQPNSDWLTSHNLAPLHGKDDKRSSRSQRVATNASTLSSAGTWSK